MLDVDNDRERVSLSLKATQEDPWKEFERRYQAGEIIDGQVTKLVPFGAFVRVAPGIEGLVHISELSHEHVETPEAVLSVGDEVRAKVIEVDVARRRVSLSMRQVSGGGAPPREPEIAAEVPVEDEQAGDMAPEPISVPQSVLDAVADAEAASPVAEVVEVADAPAEQIVVPEAAPEVIEVAEPEVEPEPEPEPELEVELEPAAEAAVTDEEPKADATQTPAADEEVSLEAILEDLKRREGRGDYDACAPRRSYRGLGFGQIDRCRNARGPRRRHPRCGPVRSRRRCGRNPGPERGHLPVRSQGG